MDVRAGSASAAYLGIEVGFSFVRVGTQGARIRPIHNYIDRVVGQTKHTLEVFYVGGIDVGILDDADGDAGSRCDAADRSGGVVDFGEVAGADTPAGSWIRAGAAAVEGEERLDHTGVFRFSESAEAMRESMRAEVVECGDTADDGSECGGNLRIGNVGHMHLAVDEEVMNLSLESAADLADVAVEFNAGAAGIDGDVGEAARSEPVGDGRDIGIGGTKLRAELLGREPLVIVGRRLVLLLREGLLEGGFLGV